MAEMRLSKYREGEWPPAPEPLAVPVLDSHTHVDLQEIPPLEAIQQAYAVGVHRVVQVGVDLASSQWGADLAQQYGAAPARRAGLAGVLATVALHPNEAPMLGSSLDEQLRGIETLAALPHVHGVGETGLDYFRTEEDGLKSQEESFRAHIQIAKQHDKTLVIHDRNAHQRVLDVLDEEGAPSRTVMHCFSGDSRFAQQCAERGFWCSFAGNVTFKNAQELRDAAKWLDADRILVETDGPFLTPLPYRGRPNGPYLVPITVRFLAEQRGTDLDEWCAQLWDNGSAAFAV